MKVLTFRDLRETKGLPFSRMQIDRMERAGHFPKRIQIGENRVAWIENEIDEWISDLAQRRQDDDASGGRDNGAAT